MKSWGEALSAIFRFLLELIGWKRETNKAKTNETAQAIDAVDGRTPPPKE